jgi:hypothetical protein
MGEEADQDSVGYRHKMSSDRRRKIRRAIPAVRKGHVREGLGKNSVAKGASRGKMLGKRQRKSSESKNGILDRDLKEQLDRWMKKTTNRIIRKTIVLKRVFEFRIAVGIEQRFTLEDLCPSKIKKILLAA